MRLYLDLCALKRPFDDPVQDRVQLEALAVASLLGAMERKELTIVSSPMLVFENGRNPDPRRLEIVQAILDQCEFSGAPDAATIDVARNLHGRGMPAPDAVHLAFAVRAGCDLFVTCDDEILSRAKTCGTMLESIEIVGPLAAVALIETGGQA